MSSDPVATPSTKNCTPAMAVVLVTSAVTVTMLETWVPLAGQSMATAGRACVFVTVTLSGEEVGGVAYGVSGARKGRGCRCWPCSSAQDTL